MKLKSRGASTFKAEVLDISLRGVWILAGDAEFFLPHRDFPWFQDATVAQVYNLVCPRKNHLRWPDLDVDLELTSLQNLEQYPLIYR